MFNRGNFGKDGEEGIIKDIESKENLVLLIKNDENSINWQHPKSITDYCKENYKKTGTVSIYDIYEK